MRPTTPENIEMDENESEPLLDETESEPLLDETESEPLLDESESEPLLDETDSEPLLTLDPLPTKLLKSLEEKFFPAFVEILKNNDSFDVNYFYGEPHNGTLLDIACRSSGNHPFVKKLLELGADINRVNEKSGLTAIHEAVQKSDVDTVNVLLDDERCDAHIFDSNFNTPVLTAALAGRRDTLSTLFKNEKVMSQSLVTDDAEIIKIADSWIKNAISQNKKSPEIKSPFSIVGNLARPYTGIYGERSKYIYDSKSSSLLPKKRQPEAKMVPKTTPSPTKNPSPDAISESAPAQTKLLHALKTQDYEKFHSILNTCQGTKDKVDVNHIYTDPENGTLLDNACRSLNNSTFVKLLKEKGADIGIRNSSQHGRSPTHTAVEFADEETLKILLDYENIDLNIEDDYGNTPLHIAAKRDKPQAARILLKQDEIQVNKLNHKLESALYLALKRNHLEVVHLLLNCCDIELDIGHDPRDLSCRQIIAEKFPRWGKESPRNLKNPKIGDLFSLLYERKTDLFINTINDDDTFVIFSVNDGFYTYLQYACDRGLADVVDKLLDLGVNPNQICPNNTSTPIMISAAKGYHEIVSKLLKTDRISLDWTNDDKETVLHTLVRGMLESYCTNEPNDQNCDYHKCLELISASPEVHKLANVPDKYGNIALYYAAKANHKKAVLLLLHIGSYICHKNQNREVILRLMDPAILEEYLDSCILTNDESCLQSDYQIILNCEIYKPPVDHPELPETELLLKLNEASDLRYLLQHPILTSFLDLKWYALKKFYYLDLIFYFFFTLFLTFFIGFLFVGPTTKPNTSPSDCISQNLTCICCPQLSDGIGEQNSTVMSSSYICCSFNKSTDDSNNSFSEWSSANKSGCFFRNGTCIGCQQLPDLNEQNSTILPVPSSNMCCLFNKSTDNQNGTSLECRSADDTGCISQNGTCIPCQQLSDATCDQNSTLCCPFDKSIDNSNIDWVRKSHIITNALRLATFICWCIFTFKELLQFWVSPRKYFTLDNIFAVALILVTIHLITRIGNHQYLDPIKLNYLLAAFAIFVAWVGLFLLIGKNPALSTNTEIFKTISINFFKFLICYYCLIAAFFLSFYILSKYYTHLQENNPNVTIFHELGSTFIRSFMLTTEFKAGYTPYDKETNIFQQILFVLFVLLITTIFRNLLSGLAVDDIKKVRKNAEILAIVSQIQFIWYLENVTSVNLFYLIVHLPEMLLYGLRCCSKKSRKNTQRLTTSYNAVIRKLTRLYPDTLPDSKIRILPNDNNVVMFVKTPGLAGGSFSLTYSTWKINANIVYSAAKILQSKSDAENK